MARNTEAEAIHVEIAHPKMTIEGYLLSNIGTDKQNPENFVFFLGIPYAKPPIEKSKRFEPPEPYVYDPERDGNPFQASKGFKIALQLDHTKGTHNNMEIRKFKKEEDDALDCLYLNIYVPKRPKEISDPLAVMVYFHGGGFYHGSGNYDERTPESMMRHGVLLVTVNYRLGPFGFLNMHAENCKGNAGLKDQVMALRWVRDNIRQFGGDSKNVTIWGESAGGSCVNFHLISPLSRGFFHKAIIQSGGIYCPWGFTGDQHAVMDKLKKHISIKEVKKEMMVEKPIQETSTDILQQPGSIAEVKEEMMVEGSIQESSTDILRQPESIAEVKEEMMVEGSIQESSTDITRQPRSIAEVKEEMMIKKLIQENSTDILQQYWTATNEEREGYRLGILWIGYWMTRVFVNF